MDFKRITDSKAVQDLKKITDSKPIKDLVQYIEEKQYMELRNLRFKQYIVLLWTIIASPIIILMLWFMFISAGWFGFMPDFETLENPRSSLASEVISSDGVVLGKYFKENRTLVDYENLSPHIVNALVATEDARFYSHSGIDFKALGRVFLGVITFTSQGGGSTVSQQLAKNLFPRDTTRNRNFVSKIFVMANTKFKEWVIAVKLEKRYTKEEIIALYFNTFDFLNLAVGIESASKVYFNTTPDKLNIHQSAMLVGMLKNPAFYNPLRRADTVLFRRNVVLNQMVRYKKISSIERDSLRLLPLGIDFQKVDHNVGTATYFREYIRMALNAKFPERTNYGSLDVFVEDSIEWETNPLFGWIDKNVKADGTKYNIYSDGLRIYTTIDSRMQLAAEEAVTEHMKNEMQPAIDREHKNNKKAPFDRQLGQEDIDRIMLNSMRRSERYHVLKNAGYSKDSIELSFKTPTQMKVFDWKRPGFEKDTILTPWDSIRYYKRFLHTGVMAMEPATGHVKAYVGDINYKHFKFNNVSQSKRQVGSTFKPFVYTLAMMEGEYGPCHKVPNIPVTFEMPQGSVPAIYEPAFSTADRLAKYEGQMITLKFGLAHSLNQISAWIMKLYGPKAVVDIARKLGVRSFLPEVYSLCVGSAEMKLSEIVGAYSSFANNGVYAQPIFVSRIEDKYGNIVGTFQSKKHEAVSPETAYKMVKLMNGVVEYGTSVRIRYKYHIMNEVAGKTGTTNDNSDGWFIGMVPDLITGVWVGGEERSIRFESNLYGQGASMALPIWGLFMQKIYANPQIQVSQQPFLRPPGLTESFDCRSEKPDSDDFEDPIKLDELNL